MPTDKSPVGFPIAHIRSKLTLSFDSDPFWRKRKIKLLKTNTTITENVSFTVYNISVETDLKSKEIREWADRVFSNTIDSKETLLLYLSFSKYEISFGDDFLSQLFEWKEVNRKLFKHTLLLMKDVELNPFTGGMGRTENLKNKGKEASKRITQGHRLSYAVEHNVVTFIACKGHYEFH